MRIGYFSPLPPDPTGIADYSAELLPYLAREFEIELIVKHPASLEAHSSLASFPRLPFAKLPEAVGRLDLLLYHMGNSPLHADIYRALQTWRGVVVMHDVVLHHLVAWLTLGHGDKEGYIEAMRDEYGDAGAELAHLETLGLASLNRFDHSLNKRAVKAARALIVHSDYAARQIQPLVSNTPVAVIPMGIEPPPEIPREIARTHLHLQNSALLIAAFGDIQSYKRITVALEAFAALRAQHPEALLWLVGRESPNYDVRAVIAMLRLEGAVRLVGFAPRAEYEEYIAAADICLNLRYPTAGETSASVLRLLAAGKATIVTRTGALAELPAPNSGAANVCLQVEPDEYEGDLLRAYLEYLAAYPDARTALGANARAYVEQCHSLEYAASCYADFLRAVHTNAAVSKSYLQPFAPTRLTRTASHPMPTTPPQELTAFDVNVQPSTVHRQPSTDWRDELARDYAELGLTAEDEVLREVAHALLDLGLDDDATPR